MLARYLRVPGACMKRASVSGLVLVKASKTTGGGGRETSISPGRQRAAVREGGGAEAFGRSRACFEQVVGCWPIRRAAG